MVGKNFAGVTKESLQNERYEQTDCKIKRCISCLQGKQTN